MKSVLVCLAIDDSAHSTAMAGNRLAALLQAVPRRVHVLEPRDDIEALVADVGLPIELVDGRPVAALLSEAMRADVVAVVLGLCAERDALKIGSVARTIASKLKKPVLIVPPTEATFENVAPKVLLPLDGAYSTSEGAREPMALLAEAGATVRVLHVFDGPDVPRFWEHAAYDADPWCRDFLARHCELPGVECLLKRGRPAELVLDVASAEHADVIALIWSQELADGRADVVRAVLQGTRVPVLLMPVRHDPRERTRVKSPATRSQPLPHH
jgi:nucleotide-binding universal stress UspA family protein